VLKANQLPVKILRQDEPLFQRVIHKLLPHRRHLPQVRLPLSEIHRILAARCIPRDDIHRNSRVHRARFDRLHQALHNESRKIVLEVK